MRIFRRLATVGFCLGLGSLSALAQQTINTVAGSGPNNLPAASSSMGVPVGISQDSSGNLYISDAHSHRVYQISTSGALIAFAGNAAPGYTGDTGAATNASLNSPTGIFVDSSGDLFIADSGNNVIREVLASTGIIQTVAGNGTAGFVDNVAATSGELSNPTGVFVDGSGDIFIADSGNHVIREVVAGATPMITTVAGNHALGGGFNGDNIPATSAQLNNPQDVTMDTAGNFFVADHDNHRVREFTVGGNIQTVAGTGVAGSSGDGGTATSAQLNGPSAVYVTGAFAGPTPTGQLYIADTNNDAIRLVTATTPLNLSKMQTVAGNGRAGFSGDGGPAKVAELFAPRAVYVDSSQNIYIGDTGNSFVRLVVALTGDIDAFAGNGTLGFSGDGSAATSASLNNPAGVAADGAGNIYIADTASNAIRQVIASSGLIQTISGRGGAACNSFGNGGSATNALLCNPSAVFVDGNGNVFIADTGNHVVREIVALTGIIQIVAGISTNPGFSGDTGFATQAQLHSPSGVFVDGSGNIFIADTGNDAIREVVAATSKIQTVAGIGTSSGYSGDNGPATSAQINSPGDVYLDGFGNIYIADTGNNVIREVFATGLNAGKITTVAGDHALPPGYSGDAGSPTAAQLNGPKGVVVDPSGSLFIADTNNHVIREVPVGTGKIQTVAGNNIAAFAGDGGAPTKASLHSPVGMALDHLGGIFIADSANNRIRDASALVPVATVTLSTPSLAFNNQVITTTSASQPVMVSNTGSAPLVIFSIAPTGTNATSFGQTNNCGTGLAAGLSCTVNVTFTPQAIGSLGANLSVFDSAPSSPQTVALSGTGVSPITLNPTGLTFTLEVNGTSSQPQSVMLTNNQAVTLNFTSIAITGANLASFSQTNTCGTSVPAGGNCTVSVIFNPTATGSNSANITFMDDAPGGMQTVALFGLGTAATADLTPSTLTFTTQQVDSASPTQAITMKNNGKDVLNISGIAFSGADPTDFGETDTCGTQLLVATTCTITVTFTPQAGGSRTATMNISDSAGNSPQVVPLAGNGLDFTISIASGGSNTQTVTAGTTATYSAQLTTIGGTSTTSTISVTLTCGNVPQGAACTVPSGTLSVTPAAATSFNVTVTTTAATTALSPRAGPDFGPGPIRPLVLLIFMALMAFLAWRMSVRNASMSARARVLGKFLQACIVILLVASASLLLGCGAPPASTTPGTPGTTPAGSYNITVSASAGNDVHTLILTLTVQ